MTTFLLVLVVLMLAAILGLGVVQFRLSRFHMEPQKPIVTPKAHAHEPAPIVYLQPSRLMNGEAVLACDHCHAPLPKGAIRTHDGLWRCAEHKAVR